MPEPQKQQAPAPVAHEKAHGFRRKMTGTVIKAKMQKTIVVECVSYRRDPLYGKYIKERRRYKAHDEKNEYKVGDEVEITEHAPMAKTKRFSVTRLVKKYVEVVSQHRDALYGKYLRRRARYKAHDEKNEYKVGDEVEIQEHRPISRDKRFIVVRLVKKFVEE